MNLSISRGVLYVNNMFLCYVSAGLEGALPTGRFNVEIRTDGAKPRVHVDSIGWVGSNREDHALILGKVIGGRSLIACDGVIERLFNLVQAREDAGERVILEIER